MSWTDEKIEKLKKLWKKGLTTVEIGKELGISKNAVVGKAHRLKLESRPSPIKKAVDKKPITPENKVEAKPTKSAKVKEQPKAKEKPQPQTQPKEKEKIIPPENMVTLMDVTATSCRWPIGDPQDPDFHFCDKEAVEGRPYCLMHCAQAYMGVNKLLKGAKQGS